MCYEQYLESCISFAKDTKKWAALNEYNWYTSDEFGSWEENCDNNNGGLDVSWAFHEPLASVREQCPSRYARCVCDRLQCLAENGVSSDDLIDAISMFKD